MHQKSNILLWGWLPTLPWVQFSLKKCRYCTPNHDTLTTSAISLDHSASSIRITFSRTTPNMCSRISSWQTQPGFFREKNLRPMVDHDGITIIASPLQTTTSCVIREHQAKYGLRQRSPASRRRRRTVGSLILALWVPGVSLAVDAAVSWRLRRWRNQISVLGWWHVACQFWPYHVLFVSWYLLLRRLIVDSCTFRCLVTAWAAIAASSMPMALSRSSARNRGMVKQQWRWV